MKRFPLLFLTVGVILVVASCGAGEEPGAGPQPGPSSVTAAEMEPVLALVNGTLIDGTGARPRIADLAVLSRNLLEIPAEEILATETVLTIVGGRVVHDGR